MAMNADHFHTHDNTTADQFYKAGQAMTQTLEDIVKMQKRIAELEKENAALKEATRWRKFSEEKPEDGQAVWAYEPNGKRVLKLEYEKSDSGEGFICFPYKHEFYPSITLWMPFEVPKAPEE